MKRALIIAGVLLAAVAGLGGWQGRELDVLRDNRQAARKQNALRAVAGDAARPIKHPRTDGAAEARRVAAEFMAYAVEMDALGYEATRNPQGALRRRIATQMEMVTSLDGRQLGVLIDEIAASRGLDESLKGTLLRWALRRLTPSRPGEALMAMTPEVRRLLGVNTSGVVANMVGDALAALCDDDPAAALAWFRENRENLESDVRKFAEARLVRATADLDLPQALRPGELGSDAHE